MALLSELVNTMELLITVSRLPLTVAVTVMVKDEPAMALEGAVMLRTACVPQPNVTNPATAVLNAHSGRAASTLHGPPRADLHEELASTGMPPAFALDNLSLSIIYPPSTLTRPSERKLQTFRLGIYREASWRGLPRRISIPTMGP